MSPKRSNIVPIRDTAFDPIFFNKEDVAVGTRLKYWGASGHSDWVVDGITTLIRDAGHYREQATDHVRILGDVVTLKRIGATETRKTSFSYLRYSAIWRMIGGKR